MNDDPMMIPDDDSDSTDDDNVQAEAYLSCGGICPFVDDTYELSVDQIYSQVIKSTISLCKETKSSVYSTCRPRTLLM